MRALLRRLLRFAVRALLVVVVLVIGAYLLRDQVLSRPLAKIVSDALSEVGVTVSLPKTPSTARERRRPRRIARESCPSSRGTIWRR